MFVRLFYWGLKIFNLIIPSPINKNFLGIRAIQLHWDELYTSIRLLTDEKIYCCFSSTTFCGRRLFWQSLNLMLSITKVCGSPNVTDSFSLFKRENASKGFSRRQHLYCNLLGPRLPNSWLSFWNNWNSVTFHLCLSVTFWKSFSSVTYLGGLL